MGLIGKLLKAGKSAAKGAKVKSANRSKITNYENFYEPAAAKAKREAGAAIKKAKKSSFVKGALTGAATTAVAKAAYDKQKKKNAKKLNK
jgi:hypothetical protein